MRLFSKKTDEEISEANNQKIEAKENKDKLNAEFKELTKDAKSYFFNTVQDSNGVANSVTIYIHNDGRAYISYLKLGNIKSTKELIEYNVVDFEWLEDIKNKGKKVIGRAVAGSLLAGPAGMIIGGVTGKNKTKDKSTAVLTLQNVEDKSVRMFSFNCDQTSMKRYKMIPKVALMDKVEIPTIQNTINETAEKSTPEQIKEFKELLDMDIITQEEFDAKKKELLNL